ncbi:hypothetical protein H4R99_001078 [Coemansia sp. RSA 1722]|nr:hypothetical protein LPJ57_002317 [Coemansia sp. RSA 486]KAJ2228515.1 hypothetical protein IWW45_006572 [Coemansia sp. RSA 485]KAJ2601837.1 hypothetical protein GGF39_001040 [Coemansia sp. RSA 1721]KAJ2605502.1 hypothetical protein H4R99_001078 [Coemansia sp. RSA 1722]KAJ2639156.1 hypothetical protein GGF40_001110 [Coemansia sp. RSA 1286]
MPSKHRSAATRHYVPDSGTTSNSPTMTIDNDSFSSTRPHIMGHPGTRMFPVHAYSIRRSPIQTGFAQLTSGRAKSPQQQQQHRSSRGITADHRLREQLILIDTPDSDSAASLVGRLAVVRPDSDNVIVVENKKNSQSSVEAIYQVIDSKADRSASRKLHRAELYAHRMPSITQKNDKDAEPRPVAIPKSRISTLRPAHRRMPSSRAVQQQGPMYTSGGALVARRPSLLMTDGVERVTGPHADVTESFYNDVGYDLADAEIDSLFCRSFDMDLLPEAPKRKISHYNIGVKDVPRLSPTPSVAESQESEPEENVVEEIGSRHVHRTLGVVSDNAQFAKPVIHEKDVDFYIRMLTLRSGARRPDSESELLPPQPRHVGFSSDSFATSTSSLPSPEHPASSRKALDLRPSVSMHGPPTPPTAASLEAPVDMSRADSGHASASVYVDAVQSSCDIDAVCSHCIFPQSRPPGARPMSAPTRDQHALADSASSANVTQIPSVHQQQRKEPQRALSSTPVTRPRRRSITAAVAGFVFGSHAGGGKQLANSRSTALVSSGDDSGYVTSHTQPLSSPRVVERIASTRSVRPMPEINELRRRSQMQSLAAREASLRDSPVDEKTVALPSGPVADGDCVCCVASSWCARSDRGRDRDRVRCCSRIRSSNRRWPSLRLPAFLKRSPTAAGVRIDQQPTVSRQPDPSPGPGPGPGPGPRRYNHADDNLSPGAWPSLTSSWGHIYHSHARTASTSRTTHMRDIFIYPFRLSYNCMLWWLAPCIAESRS